MWKNRAFLVRTGRGGQVDTLARTIRFFQLYWVSYLEGEGTEITREALKESMEILHSIIRPYLREGK